MPDINKPAVEIATNPPADPTSVSVNKMRHDRFRSQTSMFPLEEYRPNPFKRGRK